MAKNLPQVDGETILAQVAALGQIPSPSGFAYAAIDAVQTDMERLDLVARRTVNGALVVMLPGGDPALGGRTLSAHVDTLGPGVDASHSFERMHRTSLEQTARLLLAYLFTPA
jgi:putative aminopeptidase FrvX